jgi:predicted RND superfamily exporter protein
MGERWRRLPAVMATHPKRVLLVVLAATVLFGICARDVRLDNNFAALFATDSEEAKFREEHRRTWGADDGLLVAVVRVTDREPLSPDVIDLVDQMTTGALEALPALERVESITSTDVLGQTVYGPTVGPAFGPRSPFDLPAAERLALVQRTDLGAANLVDEGGRTFLIVGVLRPEYDSYESVVGPAADFEAEVGELAERSSVPVTTNFSGVAFTRIAAINMMQMDLIRLSPLATLLMALILWIVFRRVAAVMGPLLAIGASLIVTAGVIGLAGDDLNQVTIVYPILMMGVVVASSAHLVHRYYRERALGRSSTGAAQLVLERLSRPAAVAAVTTAIGFASLIIAEMKILHEFGLYLAAGVMASLLLQLAIVPAVLVWADSEPSAAYLRGPRTTDGRPGLTERYARTMLRPGAAIGVLAVGIILSIGSILIARTAIYDYKLSNMLSGDHPVAQGNKVIDTQLSGGMPIEIAFNGEPGDFRDPDVLARMDRLARWLKAEDGIRVMGLSQAVKELAAVTSPAGSGRPEPAFPTDPQAVAATLDLIAGFRDGDYLRSFVRDDWSRARFQGYSPDVGGRAAIDLKDRYEAEARSVLAGTGVTSRLTGEVPVGYQGMNELSRELIESTALALVMIIVAVLLVFRNGWLAMIAVLPNVTPILVAMAGYRLTSEVLDPLPGVVLCISIGLAADDTIHLVNRWRELRRLHPDRPATGALVEAVVTVRRAMVASSVVLVAGFLALALSDFGWNRQLGILGSVVLLLALGSDLLFGVAGLALFARRVERRQRRAVDLDADSSTEVTTPARV